MKLIWEDFEDGIYSTNTTTLYVILKFKNCYVLTYYPNNSSESEEVVNIKDQVLICTSYEIENAKKVAENHYEDPSVLLWWEHYDKS